MTFVKLALPSIPILCTLAPSGIQAATEPLTFFEQVVKWGEFGLVVMLACYICWTLTDAIRNHRKERKELVECLSTEMQARRRQDDKLIKVLTMLVAVLHRKKCLADVDSLDPENPDNLANLDGN